MSYDLRILPRAEADFRCIFSYIEKRSPQGAEAWREALDRALDAIEANPHSASLAPENDHFDFDLRHSLFKTRRGRTYRILFRIDGFRIAVFRFRGPGQALLLPDEL